MECLVLDDRQRICGAEAVWDLQMVPGHLPRCAQHKSAQVALFWRRRSERMYNRAVTRGLVSQAEMLARAERYMEAALQRWEYWEGVGAGGPLDYWLDQKP